MKRRKFLAASGTLLASGLLTGVYAWQIEPHWLEFIHLKMPVKNLPEKLSGKTLVQISDIHVGPMVNDSFLKKSFNKTTQLMPDFVVYTGDYIHYNGIETLIQLREMIPYFPKGNLGTFAILGNHDYGSKWAEPLIADKITQSLKEFGITVLRNESEQNSGLNFIGIDDYWGTNFKPESILQNVDLEQANIVLCHNPDVCDLEIWSGYNDWILSGHTHGGQVRPPFLDPLVLPVNNKDYDAGLILLNDGRKLYINRALGHLWQVRFNVRPEITVFELQRA